MRTLRTRGFTVIAAIAGFVSVAAAQQYSVTNLGNLTGFTYPSPTSINSRGQVAGGTSTSDFSITHPFRTAPNSPINPATDDLGLLPGATSGSATGINSLGQVSGTANGYADFSGRAFRGDPGNPTLVDLGVPSGTLSGLPSSFANGINDSGQVTGGTTEPVSALCPGFISHAFRTLPNGPVSTADDLGTLRVQNCQFSAGYAINASGQVAGWASSFQSFQTAFLATPGLPMDNLFSLGGPISIAFAINNAGQVVGRSDLAANSPGYFVYEPFLVNPFPHDTPPIRVDIGTLGGTQASANGINSAGQIVGNSTLAGDTVIHAYTFACEPIPGGDCINGVMTDLNNLIPANSGWVLENATAINDFGQIVGTGTLNGVFAAFRLDPIATAAAPSSGTACNGTYNGTFNGNVTITSGQTCSFITGSIRGNVTLSGGNLFLRQAVVLGNLSMQGGELSFDEVGVVGNVNVEGGDLTIVDSAIGGNVDFDGGNFSIDPSLIAGNLHIKSLPASSAMNQICGATVFGNVQVKQNAAAVLLGQGNACAGNTVLGGIQVENNTAPMAVTGNTVAGNLSCSGNTSITGSGNTVRGNKQGQCATF